MPARPHARRRPFLCLPRHPSRLRSSPDSARDPARPTSESVERLLLTLDEQRDTIFARMVADVFELLHPRHRRDRVMNFDHKLIAYGVMDRMGIGYRVERLLMDLSTILRTLDGASLPTLSLIHI